MVLRKPPPPGIKVPPRGTNAADHRSPASRSSTSPRSTGQRSRKDSWELDTDSIYSPDLHTSPAFDLMPLEEAQKSPMSPHSPWEDELVERPNGTAPLSGSMPLGMVSQSYGSQHGERSSSMSNVPQISLDTTRREPAADIQPQSTGNGPASGAHWEAVSPQRFRANNPFARARNPSPNPWENRNQPGQGQAPSDQASTASGIHLDSSERNSQTSGIIPMTARLSIFDQPEDPWTQQPSQSSLQEQTPLHGVAPAVQHDYTNASENIWQLPPSEQSAATNSHWAIQSDQTIDSHNEWQEIKPNPTSSKVEIPINNPHVSETDNQRSLSPHLIDLDDTPTEARANAWSSESQPTVPSKDEKSSTSSPSQAPPAKMPAALPPMSETELKRFQEKQLETYAIRHVNWTDDTGKLRESPVLVQNKNGPCPLLALVNGLIMRSVGSKDAQQPVVKALQTRENISLGLLIQALFDELTTYPVDILPDIEALSRFLTMLHTGMNVNPRLIIESPTSVGTFHETSDLRFYDAFKVPLLHGWIADPKSNTHAAMAKVAEYYEDIQLLQFRKEELEDRVIRSGSTLTPDEERLIAEIDIIQSFVNVENATQLSRFGLGHLSKTLASGSISILFRNDHFSTLYKHPQSGQLFTLVTDAGYADHPEIVWESLVDVSGSNAEFFAGDFRPVGHGPSGSHSTETNHLVSQRESSRTSAQAAGQGGDTSTTEQEDADYAYALSLQFQEEARQQEQQRQEQRSHTRAGSIPNNPRSSSSTVNTNNTSARGTTSGHRYTQSSSAANRLRNNSTASFPSQNTDSLNTNNIPVDGPSDHDNDDDAPPPSYDQVARNKTLAQRQQQQQRQRQRPSTGHPSIDTEYSRNNYPGAAAVGRRQEPWPPITTYDRGSRDRNGKDCIVM
ncbi:hypothetical protein BGW36DRAFT_295454 [Talaromyces proteolyticus]|uniref:MINDY deubiquitinase domain-containing protein n=1 Tax=Talaromyces proteolyticus TaxID=1131652 RepID=A0AAD4KT91_9EURO|nr:uncharacterized protein BGW36DRAFT_295454 [Talaromyces proteolyticus]KAH8697797.1 hypothetical protein BGW36DRAFT_295454 [Talaromyces proteolyticus]